MKDPMYDRPPHRCTDCSHTPTPWKASDGFIESWDEQVTIAEHVHENDAAFIVLAVNLHYDLVSQLRQYHEDAYNEDHFDRVAKGEMGCTTCTLLSKAEGKI